MNDDGPGFLEVLVIILSPVILAGLTVIFLLGWWMQSAWNWLAWRRDDRA